MNPWINAARPKTLPLAVSGILMGSAIAYLNHLFEWSIFLLGLITAVLLQILSNFANDYGDFKKGTDKAAGRKDRMLTNGTISESLMLKVLYVLAGVTLMCGVSLLFISGLKFSPVFIVFFLLGTLAIISAIKYTVGKYAYAYSGLGDIFVFIFFGLISVVGIFYLYTKVVNLESILAGLGIGFMSSAVLNVNNMRDIDSDKSSNKITIPVRIGISKAMIYHIALCVFGVSFVVLSFIRHLQTELTEIAILEYAMIIAVFSPCMVLVLSHIGHLKKIADKPNAKDKFNLFNKELKFLSLTILTITIVYWILALLYI